MADVTLSDGRELTIDLHKISMREYRSIFDPAQKPEDEDVLIARCVGMTVDEYRDLPQPDWRRVATAFFVKAREPLAEDFLAGGSTSA